MKIKRGDIVLVDLGIHENSIQSGIRPCVIVSNDKANRYSPVFTVVPLTSRLNKKIIYLLMCLSMRTSVMG